MAQVHKIFITGGPGSGKTTLAHHIGTHYAMPVYELDKVLHDPQSHGARFEVALKQQVQIIAAEKLWIAEGAYLVWVDSLLADADRIIWMDVPWRVASYRILRRHLKRTLTGNNPFPDAGWRAFLQFWRWSEAYYHDRNPLEPNLYGLPNTRSQAIAMLQPYQSKVIAWPSANDALALEKLFARNE